MDPPQPPPLGCRLSTLEVWKLPTVTKWSQISALVLTTGEALAASRLEQQWSQGGQEKMAHATAIYRKTDWRLVTTVLERV